MNIRPESIVVANNQRVSFEVPDSEIAEALALTQVPNDFPESTIRGLPILQATVGAPEKSEGDSTVWRRISFRHPRDPLSRVKSIDPADMLAKRRERRREREAQRIGKPAEPEIGKAAEPEIQA